MATYAIKRDNFTVLSADDPLAPRSQQSGLDFGYICSSPRRDLCLSAIRFRPPSSEPGLPLAFPCRQAPMSSLSSCHQRLSSFRAPAGERQTDGVGSCCTITSVPTGPAMSVMPPEAAPGRQPPDCCETAMANYDLALIVCIFLSAATLIASARVRKRH